MSYVDPDAKRKHSTYDPAVKAAATAALMAGQSINSVAREYNLPKGTVGDWKDAANAHSDGVGSDPTQKDEVGNALLGYLRANLHALRVQAELFADRAWLEKQEAQEIAVLHGIMTDKAVRLLEALSAGESE